MNFKYWIVRCKRTGKFVDQKLADQWTREQVIAWWGRHGNPKAITVRAG